MFNTPEIRDEERRTVEAFGDPQPGDHFDEMCSFHVFVVAVEPQGRVAVLEASPPCTLPGDGKLRIFTTRDEFRAAYAYGSIPGYSVRVSRKRANVSGWFAGWPDPEPGCRACADIVARSAS